MKKIIPVLLMILLLSACNFPGEVDYSEDPVVQTSVSQILTQGAQTQDTALGQKVTGSPVHQTETPPQESQTPVNTATESQTAEPELTPSQTPAPTQVNSADVLGWWGYLCWRIWQWWLLGFRKQLPLLQGLQWSTWFHFQRHSLVEQLVHNKSAI